MSPANECTKIFAVWAHKKKTLSSFSKHHDLIQHSLIIFNESFILYFYEHFHRPLLEVQHRIHSFVFSNHFILLWGSRANPENTRCKAGEFTSHGTPKLQRAPCTHVHAYGKFTIIKPHNRMFLGTHMDMREHVKLHTDSYSIAAQSYFFENLNIPVSIKTV